ncbi:hypothetical protein B0H19DRAFT_1124746 [Mycena capillaripes]|nr:hypothetical protein B0H19DRAFT_1124746 [Mycena capillaripes]
MRHVLLSLYFLRLLTTLPRLIPSGRLNGVLVVQKEEEELYYTDAVPQLEQPVYYWGQLSIILRPFFIPPCGQRPRKEREQGRPPFTPGPLSRISVSYVGRKD